MIRRALLALGDAGDLSPDAARMRELVREVLDRHHVLYAELVARGVCTSRAWALIEAATTGDAS